MRASLKALGLVMALAVAAAGCSGSSDSTPTSPGGTTGGNTGGNTGGASGSAVNISGFAFAPVALNVPAGTTVQWTNKDNTTHTVTADDGSYGSDNLGINGTYSHTYNVAGTFTYHCAIHSGMTGTITVK